MRAIRLALAGPEKAVRLQYFNTSNDFLKQLEFSFLITRVSQENIAGRIVAINGYPFCEKTSMVTPIFYCIFEMFQT